MHVSSPYGEKSLKHVQVRLEDDEAARFTAKMKSLRISKVQHAAKAAVLAWINDEKATAPIPEDPKELALRRTIAPLFERLEQIVVGQTEIAHHVQGLREKLTAALGEAPITKAVSPPPQS